MGASFLGAEGGRERGRGEGVRRGWVRTGDDGEGSSSPIQKDELWSCQ